VYRTLEKLCSELDRVGPLLGPIGGRADDARALDPGVEKLF